MKLEEENEETEELYIMIGIEISKDPNLAIIM